MPKTTRQKRGEIVYDLQQYGKNLIPQKEFERTLGYNDVTNTAAIKSYTKQLIAEGYLIRIEGGFQLTDASLSDGIIIIKVRPSQHRGAVVRGIEQALGQFRPLTTVEVEG
jgi:predicted transcriptional regulator